MRAASGPPRPWFSRAVQRSGYPLKITMEDSLLSHPERRLWLRRTLRRVRPAVVVMLAYAAWELLPVWLPYFWALVPRPAQRMIVDGFLHGLVMSYAAALVLGAGGLGVLCLTLIRNPAAPQGAAVAGPVPAARVSRYRSASPAWSWSRRPGWAGSIWAPTLPQVEPSPGLPTRFARAAEPAADRPLRILVIGESSALGEPYQPDPFDGADRGLAARARPARAAGPGGHAGRMRGHPGRDAPEAGRPHLPAGRPLALLGAQRVRGPFHLEAEHQVLRGRAVAHARDDHARVCLAVVAVLPADPGDPGAAASGRGARSDHQAAARRSAGLLAAGGRAGIVADFEGRLESIAAYCEAIGTLPIFTVPASNDGDFEPNRSVLPATAPRGDREAFAREFESPASSRPRIPPGPGPPTAP